MSNGLTGVASTDEQRQWNSGTQRSITPKLLADISFTHHRANYAFQAPDVRPHHLPLPPTPLFQIQEALRAGLKHLKLPMSSLLYKCVNAETPAMSLQEPPATHADHDGSNIFPRCSAFYEAFVAIDSGRLELLTQEQSASHLWHDSHKLRVGLPNPDNPEML